MIKATLDTGDHILIPSEVGEITFEDYCDFKEMEEKYFVSNESGDKVIDPDLSIDFLLDALAILVKGPIQQITDLGTNTDTLKDFSVFGIYNYLIGLINGYTPQELPIDFGFSWKGKWYMLDSTATYKLLTGIQPTTVEAITLLELGRLSDIKKTRGMDSTEFNLGLEHVAVLCRLPGEQLPIKREERIKFIDHRKILFSGIPMTVALDLRFFLAYTLKNLSEIAFTKISSTKNKRLVSLLRKIKPSQKRNIKPRLQHLS